QAARRNGDEVSRAEIAWAIPPGCRRPRSPGRYLHELARDPELAQVRQPYQDHIRAVGRELARRASWADHTVMLPRALACRLLGFKETTWKKCRRWLEEHGYLATVRRGRTACYRARPAVLDDGRNHAAVYVL